MNGATCERAPEPQREISRGIEELTSVINRYDNLMHRLSDRLNSVVSIAPPECQQAGKLGTDFSTDLGRNLEGLRIKMRDITNNLESLLERIEL